MYEALMFLLIWYSVSTTLFQMIWSKVFISDCGRFFDTIATFIQTIAGWIVLTGKNVAQISDGISNPVVAGIGYWLIRILVCGGCLVGAGILLAFIGIKIAEVNEDIVFYVQQIIFCRFSKYYTSHVLLSSFSIFLLLHRLYWFFHPALPYSLPQSNDKIPTL